jgi:hypothetical protein
MTTYIKTLVVISITLLSCSSQHGDLKKVCERIRNTPQDVFPNKRQDKKMKLIRQLKNLKTGETCDSLRTIFLSIDTTKKGYWEYKYEPLYILSDFNTKKSLKVLAEIIRDYPLDFPADMFFIWDLVDKTENVSIMFPDLAQSLGKQKWTDSDVLMMIISANEKRQLTREQLESSKNYLIAFYEYLKIEKYSLPGSKHYAKYYDAHLTDLLHCLRIFEPDERINLIYRDVLKLNSIFANFCSVDFAAYNTTSKGKITALFQAVLGLLENGQPVNEKYLELIAAEPLYHNDFYSELGKLHKQSFLPTNYLSQQLFAISDLAYSKEHSNHQYLDCLKLLARKEIQQGRNQGTYYFYHSTYNEKDSLINLEVSGPQPLDSTQFVLKATKTNDIYTEPFSKNKAESKIDEIIRKLSVSKKED